MKRDVLNFLRDSNPNNLTIQQIAKIKNMKEGTVDNIVKKLAENGFLHIVKEEPKRGKPRTGEVTGKKPAKPYLFEDLNFISNKEENFKYQCAPGSVRYSADFMEMYDQIADGLNQDRIFPRLVQFLEGTFNQINHSSSERVKSTAPDDRAELICSVCGFNHEMRDFVRAILLHVLDQLETNSDYIKFLWNKGCISSHRYNHLQKLSLELETKKPYTKMNNIITLRVLSTNRLEEGTSLFFGINQDSKLVCGVIDFVLLLKHGIELDTMIECDPTVMDYNDKYGIFYVKIFQSDYLKRIGNDPLFPTFSKVRSNIQRIKAIKTLSSHELFVVDAVVVEDPITSERHIGENIVRYIDTFIADSVEDKIKLVGRCDFANHLREGDRIRVIGACAIPFCDVAYDLDGPEVIDVELRLSPYGSIIKGENLNSEVIDKIKTEEIIQEMQLNDDESTRLNLRKSTRFLANVEISKSRICIVPDKTVASAVNLGFKSFLVSKFGKIKRTYQFALLSNQIHETEMFEYEINEGNDGIITSVVIINYRDKERLDEILKHVKWTLTRAINEKEFGPTYDVTYTSPKGDDRN